MQLGPRIAGYQIDEASLQDGILHRLFSIRRGEEPDPGRESGGFEVVGGFD